MKLESIVILFIFLNSSNNLSHGSESMGGKNLFSNTNNKYLEVFENKFCPLQKSFFSFWGRGGVGYLERV